MADLRDLTERLYAALGKGDADAIDALLHPDFVGTTTPGLPLGLGGVFHGPQAMRDGVWWTVGKHYRAGPQPESFEALADGRLLVTGTYRGFGRRSGRPLEAAYTHLVSERDGRIGSLTQLTDSAAWLDALGDEPATLETWTYDVTDGLATVCLGRPEAHNAIDDRVASELLVIARRIQMDPAVRAVLICGDGPDLTVGGDLAYIEDSSVEVGRLLRRMTVDWHEAFVVLSCLDAPIVTAAHGSTAGGGLGLVYAADLTIAADDAQFVTAFAGIGLSGDGGGTYHLPRRIGAARASQAYLENRPMSAVEALEWGLVNELVPAPELRDAARARAARLAQGPTRGYGAMRRLLRESWDRTLPDQLRAETDALCETSRTCDSRAALDAFARKQRPTFEGV